MDNNHKKLYSCVDYYRMAFSYRDIYEECKFLSDVFHKHTGKDIENSFELAAGPADHAFHFAGKGIKAGALDLSEEMIAYIKEHDKQNLIKTYLADMSDFKCEEEYSLAIMMLDSFAYLLTDDKIQQHFNCVADVLEENGLYIIEMDHPGSYLDSKTEKPEEETGIKWHMEDNKRKVIMHWGAPGSSFDSATQLSEIKTILEVYNKEDNSILKVEDKAIQRIFTANEFKLHIKLSGRFELVEQFRMFDIDKKFNCSSDGIRMISVLKKIK